MARGQAERLFPLIEELLSDAGLGLAELNAVAVGVGPGNFTGLRIAVAAARGLSLALGKPAIGVPNLEAMALDLPRPCLTAIDARRGMSYVQRFGDVPRGPALLTLDEIGEEWGAPNLTVSGHQAAQLAGRLGGTAASPQDPAPSIGRLAALRLRTAPEGTNWPRPAPLYLRAADAAPSADHAPPILP